MSASSLTPWFLVGFVAAACGSEPQAPDSTQAESSAAQGGIVIASSDRPPTTGSTTSNASGAGCCTMTASANAGSGGAIHTATASGISTSSASNSGIDGAGGVPSGSDAAAYGGAGHDGGPSAAGGVGQDVGETVTGGQVALPIPLGALMITEYVEGSTGSDKAIELSNLSTELLALDACRLTIYFNGKSTPGSEIALYGELPPGSSHILCHSKSSPELMGHCEQATGSASFNGDDAVVLECNGIAHDGIGQVGVLPAGDQWGNDTVGTKDQILRRRCGSTPRTDPTSAFDIGLDWVNVSAEGFAGLGDPACTEVEFEEPAEP